MSPPQELDYIGLSDASSAVVDGGGGSGGGGGGSAATRAALNLKETELRLGPPGSESPDRSDGRTPLTLTLDLLPPKSGAKRGFSLASASDAAAGGAPAGAAAVAPKADPAPPKSQIPSARADPGIAPAAKAQVVGWPPIRSYRKNTMAAEPVKKEEAESEVKQGAQVVGWPPIRSFRKNTMATNPVKKEEAEAKQGAGCLYVKVSMDGAPYLRKVDLKTHCNYKELSMALEKMFSGFTIGQCGGQGVPGRDGVNEIRLMDLLSGSEYVLTYEDKDGDWMLVGDVPWEMFSGSCRRLRIMKGSDAIGLAPRVMEKCKNRK